MNQMLRKISVFVVFLLVSILLIAGCTSNTSISRNSDNSLHADAEQPVGVFPNATIPSQQPSQETMQITTYQATADAMQLIPKIQVVPKTDRPARTALDLLTAEFKNRELISIVPPGTKVLNVKVKDHIAYANFNANIVKNNSGGSANERLLVAAIVDTLTEFPEIQKVQILVEGKKIDTINGHMDVSEPLSRSEEIIKK